MSSDPADDDGVLTPDELQRALDDEGVDQLGENRYLVRPEESSADAPAAAPSPGDALTRDDPLAAASGAEAALEAADEPHGVDITLKTDGELARTRVTSTDVREVFAEMLTWYASQLDDDLSPTEALQVMLATTDLER